MDKLTIIPKDGSIYVDGEALLEFDLSMIPDDVHALHWDNVGSLGVIERIGQADEYINAAPDWALEAVDLWTDKKNQPTKAPPETPESNKFLAQGLLADSDWTMLPDVNLSNKPDWILYRSGLRLIINNPSINPDWPAKPDELWVQP